MKVHLLIIGRESSILTKSIIIFLLSISIMPIEVFSNESNLFDDDVDTENEELVTTPKIKYVFSGSIDLRLSSTGKAKSYREGGRGVTRYGARKDNQSSNEFNLPQIILATDIFYGDEWSGYIQFNYSDHKSPIDNKEGNIGLVESYLEFSPEFNKNLKFKGGLYFPDTSLENNDIGWNTTYTITPSAINSWIGEEVKLTGLKAEYESGNFTYMLGGFSGNDPLGAILAYRGFVFSDYQGAYGDELRTQTVPIVSNNATRSFKEVDGRIGLNTSVTYRNPNFKMQLYYLNNFANNLAIEDGDYAWETNYKVISLEYLLTSNFKILSQTLFGETEMAPGFPAAVNNDFWSSYFMGVYTWGEMKHSLSLRWDIFEVDDNDLTEPDNNDSRGYAGTLAYLYRYTDSTLFGAEFLSANSQRVGNEDYSRSDPVDHLFQLMVRKYF